MTSITGKQTVDVQFRGGHEYLLTSLASLAIKNPKVPSCIFTWFPGLIRILFDEKEMIVLVKRNKINKYSQSNALIKRNGTPSGLQGILTGQKSIYTELPPSSSPFDCF